MIRIKQNYDFFYIDLRLENANSIIQFTFRDSMQSNCSQSLQQDQQSQDQSALSSLQQNQLDSVLKTLRKLKQIDKKGKLYDFKANFKKGNQVFREMSTFFHQKKRKREDFRKILKQQRIKLKKQSFKASINSIKIARYRQCAGQLSDLRQTLQNEPVIQQDHSQHLPQVKSQVFTICHTCQAKFTQIHHFYGRLCPNCVTINLAKRNQTANLQGLTALVTGGRIKIGFQIAVKLLRDGATVYVTSRFKNDTLLRYQVQKDYDQWKNRLHILQCDFMSQIQVSMLIKFLKQNVSKLDILINNAAQTIVRPKEFYALQLQKQKLQLEYPNPPQSLQLSIVQAGAEHVALPSLYSNQIAVQPGQIDLTVLDEFGQPTDNRAQNTWKLRIQNVSLLDCYSTQVINSIVPFHLISQLRSIMKGDSPSWIINVSSMEGVFYRPGKQEFHPHTNMAKAALNMITRTCAHEFLRDRIYMNSVDTGWVTNQNPKAVVQKMEEKLFKCPLDCIDGAMRVLDPIYLGLLHNQFPTGQFLKNYTASYW